MRWFLWRKSSTGYFYASHHDRRSRQVKRHGLRTKDPERAQVLFHQFVVEHGERRAADPRGVRVAEVIESYWLQHGQHLAGADVQRRALRYCVEELGELYVAELTPHRQQVFVERQRTRGHSDPYIKRTLGALRATVSRAYKRGELTSVPYIITGDLADSRPRERVLEIDEMVALWRAVDSAALARFLMLLLATGARPGVLAALTAGQIDVLRRRIDLHPPGAPETGKRNPILPIVPSLMPWVSEPRAPYVIERRMKALRDGWTIARTRAGLDRDVVPYTIRHTVATWLDEQNVPEGEIDKWLGHGKESTARHWYIKRRVYRPNYLAAAAAAVEELISAVQREAGAVGAAPASEPVPTGCVRGSYVSATNRTGTRNP